MEQYQVGYPLLDVNMPIITDANGQSFPSPIDAVQLTLLFPDIYWIEPNVLGRYVLCRVINEYTCPKISTAVTTHEPVIFDFFGGRPSKPPTR